MHSTPQITWIYGSSAAGKETFITNITDGKLSELTDRLGWTDKTVIAVKESIEYIGQFENDPITKKREAILSSAKELAKDDTILLIKGQDVDLESGLVQRLQEQFPNANHQIIFLHADYETLHTRLQNKPWWNEEENASKIIFWIKHQLAFLQSLNGFDIIALDSIGGTYDEVTFPPEV